MQNTHPLATPHYSNKTYMYSMNFSLRQYFEVQFIPSLIEYVPFYAGSHISRSSYLEMNAILLPKILWKRCLVWLSKMSWSGSFQITLLEWRQTASMKWIKRLPQADYEATNISWTFGSVINGGLPFQESLQKLILSPHLIPKK